MYPAVIPFGKETQTDPVILEEAGGGILPVDQFGPGLDIVRGESQAEIVEIQPRTLHASGDLPQPVFAAALFELHQGGVAAQPGAGRVEFDVVGVGPVKVLGAGALYPRQRSFFAVQEAEGDKTIHCIAPLCKAQSKLAPAAVGLAVELPSQRIVFLHVPVYGR